LDPDLSEKVPEQSLRPAVIDLRATARPDPLSVEPDYDVGSEGLPLAREAFLPSR